MPAWIAEGMINVRGRPPSTKTRIVLALIDGQVYIEAAIQALQERDVERAIRAMQLAREAQREAAGEVEGLGEPTCRTA